MAGVPLDSVGLGAEGFVGIGAEDAEHDRGCGSQMREPLGEAGAAGPVAILVPPAVFEKENAILDLPVIADMGQQFIGPDFARIDAGQEVARVVQTHGAVFGRNVAINAERDLAAGEVQLFANVFGVV